MKLLSNKMKNQIIKNELNTILYSIKFNLSITILKKIIFVFKILNKLNKMKHPFNIKNHFQ